MRKTWLGIFCLICFAGGCRYQTQQELMDTSLPVSLQDFFQYEEATKTPLISAHRGGPYPGYPENCLETFQNVSSSVPVLIECDVEIAGDGTLILMHDETLDRTTNGSGPVKSYSWEQLREFRLVDNQGELTAYRIPTLRETLRWAKGRSLLTVDVKRSVPFDAVISVIEEEQAVNQVVMITYTLGAAKKVHRLNPELMISVTVRNEDEFYRLQNSGIPLDRVVAFVGTSEPNSDLYGLLHQEGVYCILGTLGNLDRRAQARGDGIYKEFIENGADIIATDRPLEVADELSRYWDLQAPYQQEVLAIP